MPDVSLIYKSFNAADLNIRDDERTDVSVISTVSIDRDDEVLMPGGLDKSGYNGVVLWAHDHSLPAIGRALWVKRDGDRIVAKTRYAETPLANDVWALVRGGFLRGKSVGFDGFHGEFREPTPVEREKKGWQNVRRVWTKWPLIEYSVVNVGSNMDALVLAASKGVKVQDSTRRILGVSDWQWHRTVISTPDLTRGRRVVYSPA